MKNNPESESPDWNEIFRRKLKSLSSSEIENIIADALNKAANAEYEVELKTIDFEPCQNAVLNDTTEIRLIVKKKQKKSFFVSEKQEEKT